jgi:hypothetical protein
MPENIAHNIQEAELSGNIKQLTPFYISFPRADADIEVYQLYINRIEGWRQRAIEWALTKLPSSIMSPDGEVFITRSSLRNAFAHGKGKLKLLSIPHIPAILKNGILFHREEKNRFTFYNYTHPFIFENTPHYAIVEVREDFNGKRFYDNEFITKMADGLDYSQGLPATRQKTCAHPSTGNILRNILKVNGP